LGRPRGPQRELQALVDKLGEHPSTTVVEQGFAAHVIARALGDRPGGVVCMSTRGHTGVGAALLGSVAEEVLSITPGSVVLVGPACDPLGLAQRRGAALVVGYDGSPESDALVPVTAEWARLLGLEMHLVAVVHHDGLQVGDEPATPVRGRAHELVDDLNTQGLPARSAFPHHVDPARGLIRYAEEQHTTLIAVASRGHHAGLFEGALGEVGLRVVRHAAAPVLIVRTSDATV
jgi:nucleotide-binding universal stress UspA family protein